MILSDLLHFDSSHDALLSSLCSLLARTSSSRAYIGAGKYTRASVCSQWLRMAEEKGLVMEEIDIDDPWAGKMPVMWSGSQLDTDALSERKRNCRLWTARWKNL